MAADESKHTPERVSAIFSALSRTKRRYVLYYLRERETATLGELATVLVGWLQAREQTAEVMTPDDRERVLASLHHADLPYLEDANLVSYDLDSKEVTLDAPTDLLDGILETALAQERHTVGRTANRRSDR